MSSTRINQRSTIQTIETRKRRNERTNVFARPLEAYRHGAVWAWLDRHWALEIQCCTQHGVCCTDRPAGCGRRQTDRQPGRKMTITARTTTCGGGVSVVWSVDRCMKYDRRAVRALISPRLGCVFDRRQSLVCVSVLGFREWS